MERNRKAEKIFYTSSSPPAQKFHRRYFFAKFLSSQLPFLLGQNSSRGFVFFRTCRLWWFIMITRAGGSRCPRWLIQRRLRIRELLFFSFNCNTLCVLFVLELEGVSSDCVWGYQSMTHNRRGFEVQVEDRHASNWKQITPDYLNSFFFFLRWVFPI